MQLKKLNGPSNQLRNNRVEQFDSHRTKRCRFFYSAQFRFQIQICRELRIRRSTVVSKYRKEIDCLSDYYSKHAARTFLLNTFHDTRWCQSKTTLLSERASATRMGHACETINLARGICFFI